jgi:hypothetical protein
VRAAGKVAEVCLCYAGNLLTSPIYHVEYYKDVAKKAVEAGTGLPAFETDMVQIKLESIRSREHEGRRFSASVSHRGEPAQEHSAV